MAIEAWRIALKYMTPVAYLSDAFLANGAEPWRIPDATDAARTSRSRTPTKARPFLPVPARPGDAGPPVGRSRNAGPRAPDRRPREDRHPRQRQLRPGQPPPDAGAPPGEGRRHRRRHPAARRVRRRRGRPAHPRLGLDLRRHPQRRRAAAGGRAGRSPTRTSATSTRSRPTPATSFDRYRRVLIPRSTSGSCSMLIRARYLIDAVGLRPGPRQAVPDRRDRSRKPSACWASSRHDRR